MNSQWKSAPISATCEVLVGKIGRKLIFCDLPTAKVYPAMGRGYMALCCEHARKHDNALDVYDVIAEGEVFE